MTIVIGRGNRRQVIELPCAALVQAAEKANPQQHAANIRTLCDILGVR